MNEVLLANVFFIITGATILVVAAFLCVLTYHLIRIARTVRTIADRVQETTELFVDDARHIRDQIASGAVVARLLAIVMQGLAAARPKRRTSRRKKVHEEEDVTGESQDA